MNEWMNMRPPEPDPPPCGRYKWMVPYVNLDFMHAWLCPLYCRYNLPFDDAFLHCKNDTIKSITEKIELDFDLRRITVAKRKFKEPRQSDIAT